MIGPEAFDLLPSGVLVPGVRVRKEGVNVFECPVCRNRFRYDDEYEPICTGPHPSLDEHEPAVMVRVREDAPRLQVAAGVTLASPRG